MKHIANNKDGSYQVIDETEDGFFLVFLATIESWWNNKWTCNVCKRTYKHKKDANVCCWICQVCHKPIHGLDRAQAHLKRHNGKKQT